LASSAKWLYVHGADSSFDCLLQRIGHSEVGGEDVLKSNSPHLALNAEPAQARPVDDLPLSSKAAAGACGNVMKLNKEAFVKLDVIARLSQVVNNSRFTGVEMKGLTSPQQLQEEALQAYSLAYLTWEKTTELSRARLEKTVVGAVSSVDESSLSAAERAQLEAYLVKFKRMMLNAFDLGRHDARISPCSI